MGTHPIFESDFDCLTEMGAVKKYDNFVRRYLKKTGRQKTLIEFEKSLQREQQKEPKMPVKLSFTIQKAPERVRKDPVPGKIMEKSSKNDDEEKKALAIPEKFIKLAKKFGLPEEHLEFFFENRDSFHWESKESNIVHCTDVKCKFTMKASVGCLVDHMRTVHNYSDIPCGKKDCSYIAHSLEHLHRHQIHFHGHGKKRSEKSFHPCPYSSCNVSFGNVGMLQRHLNIHENRVYSCSYCQYRNSNYQPLKNHLAVHFNLKNFTCDICPSSFTSSHKLNMHKFTVHNSGFSCLHCQFSTSTIVKLRKHTASCKERLKHSRIL